MTSETTSIEQTDNITLNHLPLVSKSEDQPFDLNKKIKDDFTSYCYSFLNEDEDARQCVQIVWNKYLQCVGDVAMLSAFFDTLPFHVKTSVLPRYQEDIIRWCENLFHIHSKALLCSTYYSETFQRVIRYALKTDEMKKGIIYIPTDFDPNLKIDLTLALANITFTEISNDQSHEDMINISQLEQLIKQDMNQTQSYPLMVIATAGSPLLGHCDQLTKIKKLCEPYHIWLHVIGDLVGSLAFLSPNKDNVNINCDSVTIDIMKLFGIQNLPYLTFFLRSTTIDEQNSSITSHSLYDYILHSPSISFLSVWSISQRSTKENILYHMKQAFDLTNLLITRLKQIETIRILNDEDQQELNTYQRICSGDTSNDVLPKPIVIFRFQPPENISEVDNREDFNNYIDLLNLWLSEKLSQQYPKMNFELFKSAYFHTSKNDANNLHQTSPIHALRFAPLEHLYDAIEQTDMQAFLEGIQRYSDILLATMTARINLLLIIPKYDNLISVPLPNWAGIGAVRYIPSGINPLDIDETAAYQINTIQAELARQLQSNDSAFSLGGGRDEHDSMFYLRLGMIRKREDLDVLLQKISDAGKETETSLKYIEDMAEKIRSGIEQVQKDLQNENLQLLAQDGLLRQLPFVSNILSWWSPAPSASPLATKGRSFDLNSGEIESTEDTYIHRMQIKKQQLPDAPTHNDNNSTTEETSNQ